MHKGIVLVTGETGSGKSTTLAAMLDYINHTRKSHIGNTPQIANAVATSAAIGGQTMDQALVRLVRSGLITRDMALHYAHEQDYVKKNA